MLNFYILRDSCVADDESEANALNWIELDMSLNGDSEAAWFKFRSFRFADQMTIWLHCDGKIQLLYYGHCLSQAACVTQASNVLKKYI